MDRWMNRGIGVWRHEGMDGWVTIWEGVVSVHVGEGWCVYVGLCMHRGQRKTSGFLLAERMYFCAWPSRLMRKGCLPSHEHILENGAQKLRTSRGSVEAHRCRK